MNTATSLAGWISPNKTLSVSSGVCLLKQCCKFTSRSRPQLQQVEDVLQPQILCSLLKRPLRSAQWYFPSHSQARGTCCARREQQVGPTWWEQSQRRAPSCAPIELWLAATIVGLPIKVPLKIPGSRSGQRESGNLDQFLALYMHARAYAQMLIYICAHLCSFGQVP